MTFQFSFWHDLAYKVVYLSHIFLDRNFVLMWTIIGIYNSQDKEIASIDDLSQVLLHVQCKNHFLFVEGKYSKLKINASINSTINVDTSE